MCVSHSIENPHVFLEYGNVTAASRKPPLALLNMTRIDGQTIVATRNLNLAIEY